MIDTSLPSPPDGQGTDCQTCDLVGRDAVLKQLGAFLASARTDALGFGESAPPSPPVVSYAALVLLRDRFVVLPIGSTRPDDADREGG
jgi:hypothetical protein